jgi:hypothetical protein
MDASRFLIDTMHDLANIYSNHKSYRIIRRNPVGICDDLFFDVNRSFRCTDLRRAAYWNTGSAGYKRFNHVAVVTNDSGISIVIDLRDIFVADEL